MTRTRQFSSRVPAASSRARSRGFTFTEVLFAVIILGVGFIMLAAIFPVALSQTQKSADESAGAQAAGSAMAQIAAVFDGSDWSLSNIPTNSTWGPWASGTSINESLPVTIDDASPGGMGLATSAGNQTSVRIGQVHALGVAAYNGTVCTAIPAICLNEILPSNPRLAWIVLYRRDWVLSFVSSKPYYVPAPYAMLICIPMSAGVNSQFNAPYPAAAGQPPSDLPPQNWTVTSHNLQPQLVKGYITLNSAQNGFLLTTQPILANAGVDGQPWAEGTYVIVADDKDNSKTACPGLFNGHVYRIGGLATVNGGLGGWPQYYLMPGWDFTPETGISAATGQPATKLNIGNATRNGVADFYVVGRYLQGNGGFGSRYVGPSQEVGAFTTMVKCQ